MKELIVLENEAYSLTEDVATELVKITTLEKEIKVRKDNLKELLLMEMEQKQIKSIKDEINGITITYTAPTQKETFDSKKFRAEHSDLYDEYVGFSEVKSSIRVSVK